MEVPLWLAVMLRKNERCKIQAPSWMDVDFLTAKKTEGEGQNQVRFFFFLRTRKVKFDSHFFCSFFLQEFVEMPFHYREIGKQLLAVARHDIQDAAKVENLIEVRIAFFFFFHCISLMSFSFYRFVLYSYFYT